MDPTEKDQGLEELLNYWAGSAPQENVETDILTEIETPTSFLVPPTSTETSSSLLLPPVTSSILLPTPEFWTQPPTMSVNTLNQNITQESQGLPDFSVTWTDPLSSSTSTSYSPPPALTCPPSSPTFTSPISFSPLSEGRTTPYSRPPQSTTQRRLSLQENNNNNNNNNNLSLQESEEERTRRRRARNREAAARCREKRRAHEVELGRRESRLEEEGRRLGEELARLGEEKRHLVSLLALHRQLFLNRQGRTI